MSRSSRLGGLSAERDSALLAAMAIAGTIIINMAVKIGITFVYAGDAGDFRSDRDGERASSCSQS